MKNWLGDLQQKLTGRNKEDKTTKLITGSRP